MNDVFSEPCGDGVLTVVPINEEMLSAVREARERISPESWQRYTSGNHMFGKLSKIAARTLKPRQGGYVFFTIILDGEIVGLSNHLYYQSDWSENHVVSGGLVVLDEFQRRGIATAYAKISVRIARHMKAKYFYGETRKDSPMHIIRARDGWEELNAFKQHGEDWVKIRFAL